MGPLQLPLELLELIASYLPNKSFSNFCRSCRDIYAILISVLYARVKRNTALVRRTVGEGNSRRLQRLLTAGANPSITWNHRYMEWIRSTDISDPRAQSMVFSPAPTCTLLHLAARNGYDDIISMLVKHGANINSFSRDFCNCKSHADFDDLNDLPRWTPLHSAICYGKESSARLLISLGASYRVASRSVGCSGQYVTALHTASEKGALEISRFILEWYQPPLGEKDLGRGNPILGAYRSRHMDIVEFLVENGADVDNFTPSGHTLLMDACRNGRLADAHRLFKLGADGRRKFLLDGTTPLYYLCEASLYVHVQEQMPMEEPKLAELAHRVDLARDLISAGADVDARNATGATPLSVAATKGFLSMIQLLIKSGADIEARDFAGRTPLMRACLELGDFTKQLLETVKLLLQHGASVQLVDRTGQTALETMTYKCRSTLYKRSLARLLLENGSPLLSKRDPNRSRIYPFYMERDLDTCELLCKLGALPPTKPELEHMLSYSVSLNDIPALRFALRFKEIVGVRATKAIRLLVAKENAAQLALMFLNVETPYDHIAESEDEDLFDSCESNQREVIRHLLALGTDPNQSSSEGKTPLALAVSFMDTSLIELLLDHGASTYCILTTEHGEEALVDLFQRAVGLDQYATVEFMIRRGVLKGATASQCAGYIRSVPISSNRVPSNGTLELLLLANVDPNTALDDGAFFPLHTAVLQANTEAVKILIKYGADINKRPFHSSHNVPCSVNGPTTPLETAVVTTDGNRTIVDLLLHHKPFSMDESQTHLNSFVKFLCNNYCFIYFDLLFSSGVSPNVRDENGDVPLSLMFHSLDRTRTSKPWPIEYCSLVAKRLVVCVGVLVKLGCDLQARNHKGKRPLDFIRQQMDRRDDSAFDHKIAQLINQTLHVDTHGIRKKEPAWSYAYEAVMLRSESKYWFQR